MKKNQKIGILDLGLGNLGNIIKVVRKFNLNKILVNNEKDIKKVDKLIIPGVGSFSQFSKNVKKKNLINGILNHIESQKFTLGICLGMQVLANKSYEGGVYDGLKIINREVINLKSLDSNIITPNFGWYMLSSKNKKKNFLSDFVGKKFYFAHSFFCNPSNKKTDLYMKINKKEISAGFVKKNVIGIQFHPELSGKNGLVFYNKFFKL